MKIRYNITILAFLFSLSACIDNKTDVKPYERSERLSTDLQLDHFNIWTKNSTQAKKRLTEIGFTSVPDSLSAIHEGQGTSGRYFRFLNSYLELIFVYDQNELIENNKKNQDLDFTKRANFEKNGASPFSLALKVKDYNIDNIPFEKISYHQDWMDKNMNIYSAKNSKKELKEPSIFVVYPEMEYEKFETLSDLKNIPEEHAIWREFYKHPNGSQKITEIIITSRNLNLNTETIQAVNGIENLTVKDGEEHLMELHFDNDIQGKSFDLRPELPLIIYL
ncbi:MAG: VOC family protein [Winogradskyella sp.]|uniref:VOC family protein n=1 Tax=Winogradskyella sp. TaxID=1883156 RepID=UPI0025CF398E|nr:VOC family protein [Winogradskyella sp.]NRB83134.1 VOC family protein [Winogradskyella sp.]